MSTADLLSALLRRRSFLGLGAMLAGGTVSWRARDSSASPTPTPPAPAAPGGGKVGDFNFLAGEWRIHHRRPKKEGGWDEFDGEATCWTVLGGAGSIEELRIPARDFSGIGIRLLDPKTELWNDYWVNGKARTLDGGPGLTGAFVDGVGTFTATDTENGVTTTVRGVWDRITPTTHRWRQGMTRDGGKTWAEDWFMDWTRVK